MRKVYIIFEGDGVLVHKVFSSMQFVDKYLSTLSSEAVLMLSEAEEFEVEQ